MSETEGLLKEQGSKNSKFPRLALIVVIATLVAMFIVQNFGVFKNILLVMLGFGAVIMIHEFGHFIVAKLSGIRVEAFSIGFSPVLLGIRRTRAGCRIRVLPGVFKDSRNEADDGCLFDFVIGKGAADDGTEYRIGLIPFGGFVKMLGQDDLKAAEADNDPRSYANKPPEVRMGVIAAGVVLNALLAMTIFIAVFFVGIKQVPAVVGGVVPGMPADLAGMKAGDEIIELRGRKSDIDFRDIMIAAALSGKGERVEIKVRREDGSEKEFMVAAKDSQTAMGDLKIFGVLPPFTLAIGELSKKDANDLFEKTGLKAGDVVTAVNGEQVGSEWQFEEKIQKALTRSVEIAAQRKSSDGKIEAVKSEMKLALGMGSLADGNESDSGHIYSIMPRLRVVEVVPTPVMKVGMVSKLKAIIRKDVNEREIIAQIKKEEIKKGDVVVEIGGVANPTYKEMRDITTAYKDKDLVIKVLRYEQDSKAREIDVNVVPIEVEGRVLIGLMLEMDTEHAVVAKTVADEGVEKLDIPRGATITTVDGAAVKDFYDVISQIRKNEGKKIAIDWRVNDELAGSVAFNVGEAAKCVTVRSQSTEYLPFEPMVKLYKADGVMQALEMGLRRTKSFLTEALLTLRRALSGALSPKNFMGPVGIFSASYQIVASRPFIEYAYFLGLLSAFLAVMNSVPLLPFDGGHFIFLLIEKIKRSPVSQKVQDVVVRIGLTAVVVFFLYVTFNDVVRNFFS